MNRIHILCDKMKAKEENVQEFWLLTLKSLVWEVVW